MSKPRAIKAVVPECDWPRRLHTRDMQYMYNTLRLIVTCIKFPFSDRPRA